MDSNPRTSGLDADSDTPSTLARRDPYRARLVASVRQASAARQISEIARMGFDAVINLCDGSWDDERPGIEVVQALERTGMAFTGARSAFYDPSREAIKMACHSAGVKCPA